MKRYTLLLMLGYMTSCQALQAQSSSHYGFFPTIDHSGTLSDRWSYGFYYFGGVTPINPLSEGMKENPAFSVFYAEQALNYSVTPHLSLTAAYVYERQYPTQNNYRNENRLYFQATYKHDVKAVNFKHRLRYDARFVQNRSTGQTPFTPRVRYLLGITTPLSKTGKCYFTAYNELFFNTFKGADAVYGENWAYAGVGIKTAHAGTFEAGPLYIFWVNNKQRDLSNFGYLQLTWITNLDFRKKS